MKIAFKSGCNLRSCASVSKPSITGIVISRSASLIAEPCSRNRSIASGPDAASITVKPKRAVMAAITGRSSSDCGRERYCVDSRRVEEHARDEPSTRERCRDTADESGRDQTKSARQHEPANAPRAQPRRRGIEADIVFRRRAAERQRIVF